MVAQEFCLRWNNHQTNFISVFSNLLSSESLVDVTLAAEGKHVQAHKVVLSACSSYFQNLFTANPCQHPIVILKDVKYTDLKTMIDFMYCGEVNLSIEQLPAILKTAETLMVKGLAENPDQYISYEAVENKISTESCRLTPSRLMHKRLRKSSLDSGSGSTEQSTGVNEKNGDWAVYIEPIMPDNYCRRPRRSRRIKMQQREASSKAFEPVRTEPFGFLDSDESHSPPRLKNKKLRKSSADPGCSYTEQTTNFSQEMVANPQQSASQCSQKSENHPPQNKSSTLSDDKSGPDRSSINEASTGPSTTLQTHLSSGESVVHMGPCTRLRQPKTTSQCFNRKRRRIKPQQKAAFRKALEAVKTNRLSVCKAAKVYGVSHRTLRIEYIRLGYSSVNSHLKIGADLLSTAQSTQKSTKESLSMAHSTLESTSVNSSRGVGQDQMPPPTPSPPPSHCSKPNTTPLVVDLNRSNLITELAC